MEGRAGLAQQGHQDLDGLLETVEAFLHGPEGDAVGGVLVLLPAGTDAEHESPLTDRVDGGRDLGQHGRVAIGDARDER